MLGFVFGMAAGFAAGYVYGSDRAREEARRRLSAAPEPLRRATQSVASAVQVAPVPDRVKDVVNRASSSVQSVAQQAGQAVAPGPDIARPSGAEIAGRPAEPLPRIEPEAPPA